MSLAFYPPLITPTMALNMRQNASGSKTLACCVCGAVVPRKTRWQTSCSPKCRKRAYLISHRTGTYTDVRHDIAAILTRLGRLEKHFGIKERPR